MHGQSCANEPPAGGSECSVWRPSAPRGTRGDSRAAYLAGNVRSFCTSRRCWTFSFLRRCFSPGWQRWQKGQAKPFVHPVVCTKAQGLHLPMAWPDEPALGSSGEPSAGRSPRGAAATGVLTSAPRCAASANRLAGVAVASGVPTSAPTCGANASRAADEAMASGVPTSCLTREPKAGDAVANGVATSVPRPKGPKAAPPRTAGDPSCRHGDITLYWLGADPASGEPAAETCQYSGCTASGSVGKIAAAGLAGVATSRIGPAPSPLEVGEWLRLLQQASSAAGTAGGLAAPAAGLLFAEGEEVRGVPLLPAGRCWTRCGRRLRLLAAGRLAASACAAPAAGGIPAGPAASSALATLAALSKESLRAASCGAAGCPSPLASAPVLSSWKRPFSRPAWAEGQVLTRRSS
mmetsp:Transcript_69232/g.214772  ORF Transcript_69232/g.214772 Transcript_69232/m.214772 type:complete len:407 (+) Transcript_69232:99-1319(+)